MEKSENKAQIKIEVDLETREITLTGNGQSEKVPVVLLFYGSAERPGVFCYGDRTLLAGAIKGSYDLAVHFQDDGLKSVFQMLLRVTERISEHLKRWLTAEEALEKWEKPVSGFSEGNLPN